jgi:hypothetical protein
MIRIVLPPGRLVAEATTDHAERPALVTRRLLSTLVVEDAPEIGAVLAKPFTPGDVGRLVREVMGER